MSSGVLTVATLVFLCAASTGYAQGDGGDGDGGSGASLSPGFSDADLCPDCGTVEWDNSAWGTGTDWSPSQDFVAGFTPFELQILGPSAAQQFQSIQDTFQQAAASLAGDQPINYHRPTDSFAG